MEDALLKGYAATKVPEPLANCALADEPLSKSPRWKRRSKPGNRVYFEFEDRWFWHRAFNKELPSEIAFYCAALTEWVARTDALIRKLCRLGTPSELKQLSEKAGISFRRWWVEGKPLADVVQRLVNDAIRSSKQLALLQVVHQEFPS